MNRKLLSLYGLKFNPFGPELPSEALRMTPRFEDFAWCIENALVREGGFALITGDPGTGKSVALRTLAERLSGMRDLTVGAIAHPQSNLADFYREMGELFGVTLRPTNRWGGFKVLRDRWLTHIESTLIRPVLLIDEAQEMSPVVLSELRLLTSTDFDSRLLLSVVLSGDGRLREALRRDELLPLGSRIRTRLHLDYAQRDDLRACLEHLLRSAGNANLMTSELIDTLCDHAAGNYRVLTTMAAELLAAGVRREAVTLDEKLYLEVFAPTQNERPKRATRGRKAARA
jgi:type II secretory pathway predicted ATPase ExeA